MFLQDKATGEVALTITAARRILKAKRPHHAGCQRNETGVWDRSGNCERCNAFRRLNEYLVPVAKRLREIV